MKKLIRTLLCCSICMSVWLTPVFAKDVTITIDDAPLETTATPFIENDRVLVPMRAIMEALGYEIYWDSSTRSVTGIKGDTTIFLSVDYSVALVNGVHVALDAYPQIVDGTTYVPLRFLSDHSGASLEWSSGSYSVSILTDASDDSSQSISELAADSVVYIQTNTKQGSGVILSEDGLIATNFHLIDGAKTIQFKFNDRTIYQGDTTVVGFSPENDLAILKVELDNLSAATETILPEEGTSIFAIGSPLGEQNVVTNGTVLFFDENIISISAPIQNGSSGGGLFDENGSLMGITTFFTDTNYYATPIAKLSDLEEVNMDFSYMKDYVYTPSAPSSILWSVSNGFVYVSWEAVYDVDYYKIYCRKEDETTFSPLENSVTDGNVWYWSSPYCFGISTSASDKSIDIKLTSVKDGIESEFSDIITLTF